MISVYLNNRKHHTSLCERQMSTMGEQASEKSMSASKVTRVQYMLQERERSMVKRSGS